MVIGPDLQREAAPAPGSRRPVAGPAVELAAVQRPPARACRSGRGPFAVAGVRPGRRRRRRRTTSTLELAGLVAELTVAAAGARACFRVLVSASWTIR